MAGRNGRGLRPRVVVVGAGMAGLSAALHLHQHGCDVTVLEGSDRPGGRMHTVSFGKSARDIVELGANWIHGAALTNPIISLANQHGLLKDSVLLDRMEGYCYRSDGRAIKRETTLQMWAILQQAEREAYSQLHLPPGVTSFEDHIRKRCLQQMTSCVDADPTDVTAVINCMMNYVRFHTSGFPHKMGVLHTYTKIPGGNVKVPPGMNAITEALVNQLPSACVKYKHEVISIAWDSHEDIRVHCRQGEVFPAQHVIVTVSLGCLKKNHASLFQPPLPCKKVEAIHSVGFGKVNKIFLYYDKPFWSPGDGSIKLGWSDEEANIRSKNEWYKKIFCFDEVLNNPHVLVSWISGDEAEHMETLTDDDIINTCTNLIRQFLGDQSIPRANAVVRSKWCSDQLIGGSYSFATKESGVEGYDAIAEPVMCVGKMPRILFAGEGTINKMPSSMHGARTSGIREAGRLLSALGMKTVAKL